MSAALIKAAAAVGIELTLSDDRLVMKAKHKPLDDLLAEIKTHKAKIVARLQSGEIHLAWWPLPHPKITMEAPFGLDRPPAQLREAWLAIVAERPLEVGPMAWEAAMYDAALLFGDWGKRIESYQWTANNLFARHGVLVWSIRSSPVVAIGKGMASLLDGRVWTRGSAPFFNGLDARWKLEVTDPIT